MMKGDGCLRDRRTERGGEDDVRQQIPAEVHELSELHQCRPDCQGAVAIFSGGSSREGGQVAAAELWLAGVT